jgi:hypothetical protein
VDHGFGDIDPFFVVAHESPRPRHPAEGAFNDSPTLERLEAFGCVCEGEEGGFVHEFCSM